MHILVCPLDWGIGHASRCVPVIRELLKQGHRVTLAADRLPLEFLREAFPDLPSLRFPGFRVRYPDGGRMAWKMMLSAPAMIRGIVREHRHLSVLIEKYDIDLVISDNRFGLWSRKIPSVYITHQLMIKMPGGMKAFEGLFHWWHKSIINKYSACWIPDVESTPSLSGELSHKYALPGHATFVGPLSRFSRPGQVSVNQQPVRVLALISGPEPQRAIFERIMLNLLEEFAEPAVLLRGLPGNQEKLSAGPHLDIYPHLPDNEIITLIKQAEIIISRPGYSTIMDLVALGKSAVLVPTPGQTEQRYLAEHLSAENLFDYVNQDKSDIRAIINNKREEVVFPDNFNINLLGKKIQEFIEKI